MAQILDYYENTPIIAFYHSGGSRNLVTLPPGFRIKFGMVREVFSSFMVTLASGMDDCYLHPLSREDQGTSTRCKVGVRNDEIVWVRPLLRLS